MSEFQTKSLPVEIQKADNGGIHFVMSATSPDRVNDTIAEEAYTPNLGKRLPALFNHDPNKPFGTWENLKSEGGKLIGELKIAGTNLGKMIQALLDDNVPLGASIGFKGSGEPNKKGGIHFKTIELFECSVVSIPAHPRAMQIAKSFDFDLSSIEIDDNDAMSGKETDGEQSPLPDETIARAKAAVLAANQTLRTK